jgi:hypothetical protein
VQRFIIHEDIIRESNIEASLKKILGCDSRFKNIKDKSLSELMYSYDQEE